MLLEYASVGVFMAVAVGFVAFALVLSRLLRPHKPSAQKAATYECGLEPVGSGWLQFNIRFYVVALVFLVFEIEAVFIFPWAVVYDKLGLFGLVEMTVFIGILIVGLAYVWGKGDLEWVKQVMGGRGAEKALPAPDMTPSIAGRASSESGPAPGPASASGESEAAIAANARVRAASGGAGVRAASAGGASEAEAIRTGGETGGN